MITEPTYYATREDGVNLYERHSNIGMMCLEIGTDHLYSEENVSKTKGETKDALLLIWNELNNGQRKKLVKNPAIKALLVRYGVIEGDSNAD